MVPQVLVRCGCWTLYLRWLAISDLCCSSTVTYSYRRYPKSMRGGMEFDVAFLSNYVHY